jgi:hypothetical protein
MIYNFAKRMLNKFRRTLWPENGFLRHVDTVVHGGNGQERKLYASPSERYWIEPIPSACELFDASSAAKKGGNARLF